MDYSDTCYFSLDRLQSLYQRITLIYIQNSYSTLDTVFIRIYKNTYFTWRENWGYAAQDITTSIIIQSLEHGGL